MNHQNPRGGYSGRSPRPEGHYSHRYRHAGASKPSENDSFGSKERIPQKMLRGRGRNSHFVRSASGSKHFNGKPASNYVYRPKNLPLPNVSPNSLEAVGSNMKQSECLEVSDLVHGDDGIHSFSARSDSNETHLDMNRIQIGETPVKEAEDGATLRLDFLGMVRAGCISEESPLLAKADTEDEAASQEKGAKNSEGIGYLCFDICPPKTGAPVMLEPSLFVKNRQKRNEIKLSMEGQNKIELRSGMVLLKNYLSLGDQVKIAKACRDHGLGPGGFYQPGYRDGARLHLKMMCLGKNWDPETGKYEDSRLTDGAKPPIIPAEFFQFVSKAIQDSHALIKGNSKVRNVEAELPQMSPNICIVNFYSTTGKLGLHKDKDESRESLDKGLPVVSFSIGDSAEFLYGDHCDVDQAQKVKLESGDVLIFGGKSRHIFHGVSTIIPDTAPTTLLKETNMRPGRLNLTFRQY